MLQPFLCALLFASTATGAFAQATPVVPAGKPVISFSSSDTTQAIHQLFSKHRTGGWIWTSVGAAFAVRILTAGASAGNAGGTLVGTAVFGVMPAAIGVGKLTRFSEAKEDMTVAFYQKTKRLPPYVQRRLKKKYFNR
jgi:hypothetical protein